MTFKLLFQSFLFYQNNFQHDIKKKKSVHIVTTWNVYSFFYTIPLSYRQSILKGKKSKTPQM
uniref:Uncharacterized protein n=1 Tax=Anguilla anguilla TaxID=7936 RepID=A0A0E9PS23_ANGAN